MVFLGGAALATISQGKSDPVPIPTDAIPGTAHLWRTR